MTPQVVGQVLDDAQVTRRLISIVIIAGLGGFFDIFDIMILSYALPGMMKEFQFDPASLGLVGSLGQVGMIVGALLFGWLADRAGRTFVFSLDILVFSLLTGFQALTFSVGFFLVVRLLAGVGLGGAIPAEWSLISEWAPARARGRIMGTVSTLLMGGAFLAAAAGLLIVPNFGWRWLFVLAVFPAILVYFVRRGIPESPRWLASRGRAAEARKSLAFLEIRDEDIERAWEKVQRERAPETQRKASIGDLYGAGIRWGVIQLHSAWFLAATASWAFMVWMPTIMVSVYKIELVRALTYSLGIVTVQVVSRFLCTTFILDRFGRKPPQIYGFIISGLAAVGFIFVTDETTLLICALTFAFFLDQGLTGCNTALPEVLPLHLRGIGVGIGSALSRVAGVIGPFVMGVLVATGGITGGWIGAAVLLGITALLAAAIGVEPRGRNMEALSRGEEGEPATVRGKSAVSA